MSTAALLVSSSPTVDVYKRQPLPMTVRPMMSVGRSVSEFAATSASRISLMLCPVSYTHLAFAL